MTVTFLVDLAKRTFIVAKLLGLCTCIFNNINKMKLKEIEKN